MKIRQDTDDLELDESEVAPGLEHTKPRTSARSTLRPRQPHRFRRLKRLVVGTPLSTERLI
ncbi:MAG TPA: hypothetical protein VET24_08700, partial [Actinomycetota bacterium]|nr:hypothetical protein [Actinomycetota bacterium]